MDKLIERTIEFVKEKQSEFESGHDWWHTKRVWQLSKIIAKNTPCNMEVVELGALLHDIGDSKFHNGDETIGTKMAKEFLVSQNVSELIVTQVLNIIDFISFKGGNEEQGYKSIELDIVQDADRLDAIGAIGIARTFNYGGFRNRKMYDPNIAPNLNMNKEEYKKSTAPTINHFYEKLLLLKDRMNTEEGKRMAEKRHEIMLNFLEDFYAEWNIEAE